MYKPKMPPKKDKSLLTQTDLARALGWNCNVVAYHIYTTGRIPGPTHRKGLARRLYYTPAEMAKIVKQIENGEL